MRYVWAPSLALALWGGLSSAQAAVLVHIDLTSQTMHVESAQGDHDWPVSTGRPGHRTPTGTYSPQRMYPIAFSHKYENAPMPHAIFFTGGYAIHGTYATAMLGQVASHGCIRLAPGNAATLYDMVRHEGARIEISGHAPGSDALEAERAPHRGGHAQAAARREGTFDEALGYAQSRPHRSLLNWADNPLENQ